MKKSINLFIAFSCVLITTNCNSQEAKVTTVTSPSNDVVQLPVPYATPSITKNSQVIGWPADKTPIAPKGFTVNRFASKLKSPRWIYVSPDNEIFVSEASTNKNNSNNDILLFKDTNNDGVADTQTTFLTGLHLPFGMLVLGNYFYVGCTDGLYRYPYTKGQTSITAPGKKILELPAGGYNNHWTRNIIASKDGSKIYVSVGSGSNAAEHGMGNEARRADILEINPDGTGEIVYASGIRNPVGMAWQPGTSTLWTAVNERDDLGDNLVPDYFTSVKKGGFYGWPYAYYGPHPDPRLKGEHPELVEKSIVPDVSMGPHTASLGLAFYTKDAFPKKYINGAFIGQHGSWNSSVFTGYKVLFVPFTKGKPGKKEDFLTGFIANADKNTVYGRPVGVAVLPDGSMLVADDGGNIIWRITANKI